MNGFEYVGLNLLHTLLLDAFVRFTLLLLAAWAATRCFRHISAARQHFVWLSALIGVVYVTVASLMLPVRHALGLPVGSAAMPVTVWRYDKAIQETVTPSKLQQFPSWYGSKESVLVSPLASAVVYHNVGYDYLNLKTLQYLMAIWPVGFFLTLLRYARIRRALQRLQQRSHPLANPTIQTILCQVAERLGIKRLPLLLTLESNAGAFSPLTWGWRRAFLLFPADVETWQRERVEAVLLHELAHIQRGDWLTQRMADAICALFWFHPLVWLAAKNLRACAERACDDVALTQGIAPARYAQHLLEIVQTLRPHPIAPATTLPFLRGSQLETRVRAILDGAIPRRAFSRTWQCGILIGGAVCLMPFALALPITTQPIKYIVADTQTATNDKVTLPDGVTVELLGVTNSDKGARRKPAVWWKPDGTPLAAPLYKQTVADADFNRSKSSFFDHILTFSFKVSGLKSPALTDSNVRMTQALVKNSFMTGGAVNISVPHNANAFCYEVHAGFGRTQRPDTTALQLKIARAPWQTEAAATSQPAIIHVSDALTVTFGKTGKEEAGIATHRQEFSTGKRNSGRKSSELAVIVRFEKSLTEDDADRRVVVVDDQGKTIPLGGSDTLVYGSDQTGKPEIHLLVAIPETLRGHIRQYQLQTRPYQYVDFPNIALKPAKP